MPSGGIDAMYLKNVLGQIQAYCSNIHSDGSSLNVAFNTTTLWHFDAGEQGPSTPSPHDLASQTGAARIKGSRFYQD